MENMSIFDLMYDEFKIKNELKVIELFAGYGSQSLALKMLGVSFNHWRIAEWGIPSIIAYACLHRNELKEYGNNFCGDLTKEQIADLLFQMGVSADYNKPATLEQLKRMSDEKLRLIFNSIMWTNNLVDISRVKGQDLAIEDNTKFTYLLTYSFPCQNLSLAGKMASLKSKSEINEDNLYDIDNRSNMLWQVERILAECNEMGKQHLPNILIMENVTQIHNQENMTHFKQWQLRLEELGYQNYWSDLSATEYGIPQTRNRTFMISILGNYNYKFPKPVELKLRLKDLLEKNVDDSYYLSDKMIDYVSATGGGTLNTKTQKLISQSQDHSQLNKTKEQVQQITYVENCPEEFDLSKVKGTKNRAELLLLLSGKGELENHKLPNGCDSSLNNPKIREISNTITTRYDAGIQNQQQIGMCVAESIKIKNATAKGYLEAEDGDGVDISSRMESHRGTVQKGKCQTLTTMGGENIGVVVKETIPNEVKTLGNYSPSNHNASRIVDVGGG